MTKPLYVLVGDRLMNFTHGGSRSVRISPISDDGLKSRLDSVDCGADDLHVLHFKFIGDTGVLELLNKVVAERFDLPDRHIRVELSQQPDNLIQGKGEAVDAARGVLISAALIHCIIPRSVWIEYRAKHAAEMIRREEWWRARPVSPNPEEAA